jgi:hypothetical protein
MVLLDRWMQEYTEGDEQEEKNLRPSRAFLHFFQISGAPVK